jgi:hypothetical protein
VQKKKVEKLFPPWIAQNFSKNIQITAAKKNRESPTPISDFRPWASKSCMQSSGFLKVLLKSLQQVDYGDTL